jgi:hypothetical protein
MRSGTRSEPEFCCVEVDRARVDTLISISYFAIFTRENNFASDWRVRPGRTGHYLSNLTTISRLVITAL